MRTESSRTLLAVTLVLALVLGAAAEAQAEPASPEQARAEVARAVKAYNLGDFTQALVHYGEAYRLDPRPGMLFNIAQCHRQLGDYPKAAFFYRRYLAQFPDSKPPQAELVQRLIEEADRRAEEAHASAAEPVAEPVADAPIAAAEVAPPAPAVQVSPTEQVLDAPTVVTLAAIPTSELPKRDTVLNRWWFWTGVAVAAVAAGTTVYLATPPDPRSTTLGTWDLR
ncbi:MAG: tetratricopeptide repeat protein [Myxococcaceae bacterium]